MNPEHRKDLADLQDLALIVEDRDAAEQLIRVIGAVVSLYDQHAVDDRGRCSRCRPPGHLPWRRRRPCSVGDTFTAYGVAISSLRNGT
jgi:hypothetical protein